MNGDIEINGNMELSKHSPLEQHNEGVMEENVDEKAVSKSQQRFFGMVDAYKKGELDDASKAIKDAADGMSMKQVKDFAKTKHKGLPNHVDESGLRKIVSESIQKIINESFKSRIIKNFVDKYGMGSPNPALSEITDDMIFKSDVVTEYPSWAVTDENRWNYVVYRGDKNVWLILTMNPEFKDKFGYDYFDWGKQQPYLKGAYDEISRRKWGAHKNDGDYIYQTRPSFQNPLSKHYTSKDFSDDISRHIKEPVNGKFSNLQEKLNESALRKVVRRTLTKICENINLPSNEVPGENVYTMEDWQRDGTLKVAEGQLIAPDVYFQLLESVPPASTGRIFQPGEAHSYDWKHGVQLYQTFKNEGNNYYRYVGLKPLAGYGLQGDSEQLYHQFNENVNEISHDTIDNAYIKAVRDTNVLPYGTPERVRRDAQVKNIKKLRNDRLGFDPVEMSVKMRQQGTSGDPTIDRKWATWQRNHNDRVSGKRTYDDKVGKWVTHLNENELKNIIRETVQTHLVNVLGKYTQGKVSSKEANKAIMDLANDDNTLKNM